MPSIATGFESFRCSSIRAVASLCQTTSLVHLLAWLAELVIHW